MVEYYADVNRLSFNRNDNLNMSVMAKKANNILTEKKKRYRF